SAHLEVERIHIGREDRDVARSKIGDHFGRMPQTREAEEWRLRRAFQGPVYGAKTLLDLILAFLFVLFAEIGVRPRVTADGVACGGDLSQDFGMPSGVLAYGKKHCTDALIRERLENCRRVARPGSVIECEDNFVIAEKVHLLEVLEAES